MKLLLCTDGSVSSIQTADLVHKLRLPKETKITVLGVSENIDHLENLTKAMDQINEKLGTNYSLDRKIRNGNPIEEIMTEAVESSYDLVAVSGGGEQLGLLHPRLGSTASKLARKLNTHFLVARNIPAEISKILFAVGTEGTSVRTIKLGGSWISNTNAQVELLHVLMPQTSKNKDITDKSILDAAKSQLRDVGFKNDIAFSSRQGLVVEQVLKELQEGRYELLVVGAHYQPGHDRWQGALLDDITDQLLNRSSCSVLII